MTGISDIAKNSFSVKLVSKINDNFQALIQVNLSYETLINSYQGIIFIAKEIYQIIYSLQKGVDLL